MLNLRNIVLVLGGALLLTACGGGGGGTPQETPPNTGNPGSPPPIAGVSGTVTAPDGATPVAGATVWIPAMASASAMGLAAADEFALQPTAMPAAIQIACPPPPVAYQVYTCTLSDGTFTLDTTGFSDGTLTVEVKKSFFSKQFTTMLSNGAAAVGTVALPADPAAGAGRFAVIQGAYDRMEDILAKMGMGNLDPTTYRLIPGTETFALLPDSLPLFLDTDADGKPDIYNYDVVFINCGQFNEIEILVNAAYRKILADYVMQGGVLYVTDQAYDFIEQVFPNYLDFLGDDMVPAVQAEGFSVAEQGAGNLSIDASVGDNLLAQWLTHVTCQGGACLNPDGTVPIAGFLSAWAVFHGSHPGQAGNVTTWVSGQVTWLDILDPLAPQKQAVKPLTTTLRIGQGKVLYSSYHTDELQPAPGFWPQERILQYLVFEL